MRYKQCEKCRYCQKRWNKDRFGNYVDGYYGCNFLPYWGKHIETIGTCPKIEQGREESSLSACCKVNTK
jgi:hypothetical protein